MTNKATTQQSVCEQSHENGIQINLFVQLDVYSFFLEYAGVPCIITLRQLHRLVYVAHKPRKKLRLRPSKVSKAVAPANSHNQISSESSAEWSAPVDALSYHCKSVMLPNTDKATMFTKGNRNGAMVA